MKKTSISLEKSVILRKVYLAGIRLKELYKIKV